MNASLSARSPNRSRLRMNASGSPSRARRAAEWVGVGDDRVRAAAGGGGGAPHPLTPPLGDAPDRPPVLAPPLGVADPAGHDRGRALAPPAARQVLPDHGHEPLRDAVR